jgi:hypothetical protein
MRGKWRFAAAVVAPVLTCCLVVGCGGSSSPRDAAATFAVPAGLVPLAGDGFRIGLPNPATSRVQTVSTSAGPVSTRVWTATGTTDAYVVALNAYPDSTSVDLIGAVNGVASTFTGTVATNVALTVLGRPAREARITGSSSGTAVTVELLVVDDNGKLFQLQYVSRGKAFLKPPATFRSVVSSLGFG